jgi:hypothetical protein
MGYGNGVAWVLVCSRACSLRVLFLEELSGVPCLRLRSGEKMVHILRSRILIEHVHM